jgi:xanthine dehydrogenase YagT iron-sulfur-binding subunit
MAFEDDDRDRSSGPEDPPGFSFTRRAFLKTVSGTTLAAGVISPAVAEAQGDAPTPVGPGPVPISLTINGTKHALEIEPRTTLLDAMRDRLDITGVKRVCDRGTCGACTVIVDGRTQYACSHLAIEMQGVNIRTVEPSARRTA